jgi:parallel beta-helix repeat protein
MWIIKKVSSLRSQVSRFGILLFLVACSLQPVAYSLLYAQNAKVKVPADVTTQTIIFNPQAIEPWTCDATCEGKIYYDSNTDKKRHFYCDGTAWRTFDPSKTVATKIVAVKRNPPDSALDSSDPSRADYICDGTNDQEEINRAINSLPANGGAVYLLEGTYNISGSISFTASGKSLIGAGSATVLRFASGSNINIINATGVSNILIAQLMIDGNNKTGINTNGIYFDSVTYSKIDKVWVKNMKYMGIYLNNSSNNNISGNNVQSNGFAGIYLNNSSNNNTISGNNAQSNLQHGILLSNSSSNNTISGNNFLSNSVEGIILSVSSSNNTISGNIVWSSGYYGISINYSSNNNTVSGNIVGSSTYFGINLFESCNNNTVIGNNVLLNGQFGIYLMTSSCRNILSGNVIYDNGVTYSWCSGIMIENNSDDNIISYNLLSDSSGTGRPIYICGGAAGTSDNNYIVGNQISTWPASPADKIGDYGTNTRYTDKVKITLEPGGYTLPLFAILTPTGPTSYIRLNVPGPGPVLLGTAVNTAIADGKSPGDILILENTNTTGIIITDNWNVQLSPILHPSGSVTLNQNDTLTLIWDGTTGITDWIETGYADN